MNRRAGFLPIILLSIVFYGCASGVPPEEVAQVYYNLGNSYEEQNRQSDAIKAYTKALEYDQDLFSAGYNLARVYLNMEKFAEADALLEELLEKDPENSILLETRAWSLYLQGRPSAALAIYEDILKRVPNHENALFNAGVLSMEAGETERAWGHLSALYAYTPEDKELLLRLGFVERERGNPQDAADILKSLADTDPENREALIALGELYTELGFYGDAVDMLKRAVEIEASPELDFMRARILLTAVEDYEAGMEVLRAALEAGYNDPDSLRELAEYPDLYKGDEIVSFLEEQGVYSPQPEDEPGESVRPGL